MPTDPPHPPRHPPGFRFSASDAIVILVGVVATATTWKYLGNFAWLPAIVLLHFFFFCNVFRLRRSSELLWAGTFIVNGPAWCRDGSFHVLGVLAVQLPITLALIVLEIRSKQYHGIGYRRFRHTAGLIFLKS